MKNKPDLTQNRLSFNGYGGAFGWQSNPIKMHPHSHDEADEQSLWLLNWWKISKMLLWEIFQWVSKKKKWLKFVGKTLTCSQMTRLTPHSCLHSECEAKASSWFRIRIPAPQKLINWNILLCLFCLYNRAKEQSGTLPALETTTYRFTLFVQIKQTKI